LILVMTVNPGYSGQKFMPETVAKVKEVYSMVKSMKTPPIIEVDGGVNPDTIALVRDAGANAYVSASAIFHYPDGILAGVASLRKLLP
jgi:ribulose-phosphate 3-epimerase